MIIAAEELGPEGERMRGYADAVHLAGSHLHGLINDILDIAKMEAGKLELEEEHVDLAAEVAGCVRLLCPPGAAEPSAACHLNVEAAPVVRGDARRLRQIVVNLLSNALKFTPPEGRVEVTVAMLPDGGCGIRVSDTGVGVAPQDLERILRPFEQARGSPLHSDPAERIGANGDANGGGGGMGGAMGGGSGLGLAIANSLAALHDATLELGASEEGGLSVFVRFPPARVSAAREGFRAGR